MILTAVKNGCTDYYQEQPLFDLWYADLGLT